MCSLAIECVLLLKEEKEAKGAHVKEGDTAVRMFGVCVFSDYRMCSLAIECVLLLCAAGGRYCGTHVWW